MDVRRQKSDGNSGDTNQNDVQPAGDINNTDLLVRTKSAECKSDTSDKSPQVQYAGPELVVCVNLQLRSKTATVDPNKGCKLKCYKHECCD